MASNKKLQLAIYWGAGCGGCDVAILDTNEFILEVAKVADIRLWPLAVDGKYADVEAMADGELDLALFNGAVRNSENEGIARLLRRKSKLMVAFGACAHMGGIPGLANFASKQEIFECAYLKNPSLEPGSRVVPQPHSKVNGYDLEIPEFYSRVYKLDDVVDVDYYLPGCPPAFDQVKAVILVLASGNLPPKGAVVGASERTLCDECKRVKTEKKIKKFYRPWQIMQDPAACLVEQGILCAGSATRGGCGVRCPDAGIPCRGCYGPAPNVIDPGVKLLSAIAAIVDSKDPEEIAHILAGLPDFAACAYRFGAPASFLQRSHRS
jgi:F420-non-reducing hydrogenase small subunit